MIKKLQFLCIFILISLFSAGLIFAQNLTWDIGLFKGSDSGAEFKSVTIENGQKLSLFISPATESFCYIVLQNQDRKLFLLHSKSIKGKRELNIDPLLEDNTPGTKTLYVIMSKTQQTKLEKVIDSFNKNPNSAANTNNLNREIADIQDIVSGLGEPASSIIPIGGTTRGSEAKDYATRFSDKDLYVKAITIKIGS